MKQCQTTCNFGELIPTYLKERSFFGYTPHVLKSGIQKYARRAEIDKGLWCLIEMDLFSLLEWDGLTLEAYLKAYPKETRSNVMQSARRLRTNMFNRLVALMSEEVNVSAWWMPIKVRELYQRWCSNRGNPDSRKYLYDTYLYLTSQRMIRLISDLKSVYILPPYYVKNEQMNDFMKIHRDIRALYPAVFANQSSVGDIDWDLNGYPANLRPCIKGIIYNLEACSDNAFYWISRLCSLEKEACVTQYRYQKLVGKLMHDFIDRHSEYHFLRESISALEFFFKKMKHREKPIYLYHAALLLIHRNEIDLNSTDPGIDTPKEYVEQLYREHLAGGKMPVDAYILDLHTHGGKRADDCLEAFALEGAFIKNENVDFFRPDYREIYVMLKQELDHYRCNGGRLQ